MTDELCRFAVPDEHDGFVGMSVTVGSNVYVKQGEGLLVGSHDQMRQLAQGLLVRLEAARALTPGDTQ